MRLSDGLPPEPIEPLISALEHPVRSRVLALLTDRSASAAEIAEEIDEPASKVRYHLRALAKDGLIGVVETKKRRGTSERRWVSSTPQVIHEEQLLRLSSEQLRISTLFYLRLMFADAARAVREGTFDRRADNCMVRFRPRIDERGWSELVEVFLRAVAETAMVTERSAARLAVSEEDPIMVGASLMLFEMAESTEPIPGATPLADPEEAP